MPENSQPGVGTLRVLALVVVASAAAGSASAAQVWVAPSAVKIRPAAQPPSNATSSAKISAALNEFESFHVVVTGAATDVSMALEGLSDGAGDIITGRDVVLYREALIQVTSPSGGDGATGFWPDALVPDVDPIAREKRNAFPFSVPAGESRAVLVDIHVPQNALAGVYRGIINVTGGVTAQVPVELTVWDFAVPSTSTLKSAFGLNWNAPCVGHGDNNCSHYPSDLALRARYVQAALDNHLSIRDPFYSPTVSSTGVANWSDFDTYVAPFLDGTANTRLPGARLTTVKVSDGWATPVVAGWGSHFRQKGWSTTVFDYTCDEPPQTCQWSDINPRIVSSHAGDPSVPTLVTTTTAAAQQNGIVGLDLFVPEINQMEGKPGSQWAGDQRSKYPANIWWYQSCDSFGCAAGSTVTGWPTYAIDSDATRNRAMEWMSFTYNIQGELYYETAMAYYLGDPWVTQSAFGGNGDGTLFYPGTTARIGGQTEIPIESLRMKAIRDGMEDYELLAFATKLGMGAQAMALARSVFPVTYQSTTTPETLDVARGELAALILHGLGKDVQPPPPDGGQGADGGTQGADGGTQGADGGTLSVDAGSDAGSDPGGNPGNPRVATAGLTGGCSSSGVQWAWLCIPALAIAARRKRRKLPN
ncbi:MAG: DUF4091 domain-containing protein [Deltaproteobacteria bacterium]|nr:MAG: DUF4091 domain-containing protein [Deltaproteobacteria bacterium]